MRQQTLQKYSLLASLASLKMGRWAKPTSRTQSYSTLVVFLLLSLISGISGCGYNLRKGKSDALDKLGVHRIYVTPVINDSYRYGVENVVYNQLIRSLASFGGVKLVSNPDDADAMLAGRVTQASSVFNSTTAATALNPSSLLTTAQVQQFGSTLVASEYRADLTCSFVLIRRKGVPLFIPTTLVGPPAPVPSTGIIWTATFSRSKPYPASNQLGVIGDTSPLINDSEFDRTLLDIAQSMMLDVRESMVSRF